MSKMSDSRSALQLKASVENMFGKMFELGSLMKHAREFGGRMQEMNERLKELRVEGNAAGGLVTANVNGLQELVSCKIDPGLFQQGDAELLEELIVNAVNDAVEQSRVQQAETMKSLTENVDMSGLSGIIEKLTK
jgi:DNA-binding YbaB/EbfC family protein